MLKLIGARLRAVGSYSGLLEGLGIGGAAPVHSMIFEGRSIKNETVQAYNHHRHPPGSTNTSKYEGIRCPIPEIVP